MSNEYHVPSEIEQFTLGRVVWLRRSLHTSSRSVVPGHVVGFSVNVMQEVVICVKWAYDDAIHHLHPHNLTFERV